MDSIGVSAERTRVDVDAAVRTESKMVSLLKSVSSSSMDELKPRRSTSELASVDDRSSEVSLRRGTSGNERGRVANPGGPDPER